VGRQSSRDGLRKTPGWSGNKNTVSGQTTGVYGVFFSPCRQMLGYLQTDQLKWGRQDALPHWENGRTSEFIQIICVGFYTQTLRFKITTSWNSPHNDIQQTFTLSPLTTLYVNVQCFFRRTSLVLHKTALCQFSPRHTMGFTANSLNSLPVSLTITTWTCVYTNFSNAHNKW
jgi:hypothetical protein